MPVGEYELTYETMAFKEDANMSSTAAALTLSRDGQRLGTLLPERRYYKSFDQGTTEVSIFSDLREDFYLILVGSAEDGSAKFQVYINPLVNFVWLGSIVLILGSIWAMWPTARDRRIARIDRSAAAPHYSPAQWEHSTMRIGGVIILARDIGRVRSSGLSGSNKGGSRRAGLLCGDCARESLATCLCGFATQQREDIGSSLERRKDGPRDDRRVRLGVWADGAASPPLRV